MNFFFCYSVAVLNMHIPEKCRSLLTTASHLEISSLKETILGFSCLAQHKLSKLTKLFKPFALFECQNF